MQFTNNVELQEFAQLKTQEKQIKARLSELTPTVTTFLEEIGEHVDVEGGKLGLTTTKAWQYPKYITSQVEKKKQEIKVLEKTYQIKNPDSFTGTQTPRFYEEKQ
jgi:hypothetical protein